MSKRMRKIIATIFSAIMIFQAFSRTLDVAAKEVRKVRLANQYGSFYQQKIDQDVLLNSYSGLPSQNEVMTKNVETTSSTETYDPELEVVEERTINSKTYQVTPGTYVKEVYFEPIHTEVNGELVDIDNTLENISTARSIPVYENKVGFYDVKIANNTLLMTNNEAQSISFTQDGNVFNYNVKDNVILYSEMYENIDMEYALGGNTIANTFYINGPITQEKISYTITYGDLIVKEEENSYLFIDSQDNLIFTYQKPVLAENGETQAIDIDAEITNGEIKITLSLPVSWISASERIYPLSLQAALTDDSPKINITSAYISEQQQDRNSQYHDLYVGFEDGYFAMGQYLGATRTYIRAGDLGIGSDKEIVSATLQLYKFVNFDEQWQTIEIRKSDGYVDVDNVTWRTKPTDESLTYVSTTTIPGNGYKDFDITSYIKDIYNGKNNAIELRATNESSAYGPCIFYGESGPDYGLPKITLTYRDAFDVNPDLDINLIDMEMRIYAKKDEGFYAISFDGIAKPDSQVNFELVNKGDSVVFDTVAVNSDRYFVDPVFVSNPLSNVQSYTKNDSNYTTDYILEDQILEYDVPYEYIMRVKQGNDQSAVELRSDAFVKYKVKLGDTLRTISAYYGVEVDQIKTDNNLDCDVIQEGDVLLVRMKKDNPKVSADVYTPPLRTIEYKAIYVNRGPRCYGSCDVIDPVNSNVGNYFYESTDFSLQDFDEIPFLRYYNSLGPVVSGMFGNGFTTELESYLSYDIDGHLLFFKGDGKIYKIEVDGDTLTPKLTDRLEVTKENNQIKIYHIDSKDTYIFDSFGSLVQIIKETGYTIDIEYDTYGLITTIYIGNKTITFNYNENNLVKEVVLPSGQSTKYRYDENRNLVSFIDASGKEETYQYEDLSQNQDNRLLYMTDKNGNETAKNTYDQDGRVVEQEDANGNVTTISYDENSSIVTNSDGSVDIYEFNHDYRTTSIQKDGQETSAYTYDAYGNIASKKDAEGNVTSYDYNGYDVTKITYPDGTYESYQYDNHHNVTYQRDSEGIETYFQYNGYDLINISNSENANTAYEYDDQHRVVKETNQFGVSKSYSYEGNQVTSVTHSNGLVEYYVYDANGNLIKEWDNQGKNTTYIYNNQNQMIQKNYYDGSNEKWVYDGYGNIISYQNRLGGVIHYTYDKNHNQIKVTQGDLVSTTRYDSMNRIISETNEQGLTTSYTYDHLGNKKTETDAYGNVTSYSYDLKGRVIKTEDALGNVEENIYDQDNLVKSISKEGLMTEYVYDENNRQIEVIHPNATSETKTYDTFGKIISQVDVKGNQTIYEYDAYGRTIKTTITYADGLSTTTVHCYDVYGNVVSTDIDGKVTTNTYDIYQREVASTNALGYTTRKEYDLEDRIIKEIDALGNYTTTLYNANADIIETTDKNGHTTKTMYDVYGAKTAEEDANSYVTTYTYNNKGQVVKKVDPYLHTTVYRYDQYGNTIEIKVDDIVTSTNHYDDYGRKIESMTLNAHTTTKYDNLGRVITSTNQLSGLSVYYTYDKYGNSIKEKDSKGLLKETSYDEYQRVISTTDAYGRIEEKVYDSRDHIIETKNYDGTITSSTYDVYGNKLTSVDTLGLETTYTYDQLQRQVEVVTGDRITNYLYDANGQILETTTNGITTKNEYDPNGNVVKTIDALGYTKENIYDSENQVIETIDENAQHTKQSYDAYGNVVSTIDGLGNQTTKEYNVFGQVVKEIDALGFVEEYIYNQKNQLIEFIDKNGYRTTMTYNDANLLESETKPNGATTTYKYDIYGREEKIVEPNAKVKTYKYDVLGNVIEAVDGVRKTITSYDQLGNLVSIITNGVVIEKNSYNDINQLVEQIDGNGNSTTYTYDQYGQVIEINEKGYQTVLVYDLFGNVVKQIENDTLITEHIYNEKQQLIETKINGRSTLQKEYDPIGNNIVIIEQGMKITIEYDALSRVIKTYIPNVSDSNIMEVYQEAIYDQVGNIASIVDAEGYTTDKTYDAYGNVTSQTDGNGNTSYYEYDCVYNLIKVQDVNERLVEYTYDVANNVIYKKVNNKVAEYSYDKDGNLLKEKNEYGYSSKYTYDVFGNRISYTKPDGSKTTYTYDALGNKLSEGDSTFTYDSRNNQLTATNQQGTVSYTYNSFNQMIESTDTNDNVVTYNYDHHLQLIEKTYVGKTVEYVYNDHGLLVLITSDGEEIASYQYNHRNEAIVIIQENVVTEKVYDTMGKIASQKSTKDNEAIYEVSYQYDGNGNIIEEVVNAKTNRYAYNEYDELIESNKYIEDSYVYTTYQYDIHGNQIVSDTEKGKKEYSYNDKGQIKSITSKEGTIDFTYDDNGNIVSKTDVNGHKETYEYNENNQLVTLKQGQYVYTYEYDGNQERITTTKTDTKDYHYDVWYDYVVEVDVVSEESFDSVFENLQDQIKTKRANSNTCTSTLKDKYDVAYYKEPEVTKYVLDRNIENSIVLASNDEINIYEDSRLVLVDNEIQVTGMNQTVVASVSGSDVETYYYDDYGNSSSIGHGYNGELKDETGLIYLRARYYDPSIARFIQIDTNYEGEKEEVVTQNRYTYTLNNPYKYVDRDGNAVEADGIGGGSSLAGLIQSPANGWLPVSWIAKSATETYFVNWYLIHNFNSKYYQDGIAQYRRRKSSARVNDTSKIKLQATSTSGSGGSGGSGTGTTNNNGNTGIGNTGDNSQSDTNSNPVRTFTNVETECPKINLLSIQNVVANQRTKKEKVLRLLGFKVSLTLYTGNEVTNYANNIENAIVNFVSTNETNYGEKDTSVEAAIELFGAIGASISFSLSKVTASIYANISNVEIRASVFVSYNLLFGYHGFSISVEQGGGEHFIGIDFEASAMGIMIVFLAIYLYGGIPTLINLIFGGTGPISNYW